MAAILVHTSTAQSSREAARAGDVFARMAALADQRRAEVAHAAMADRAERLTAQLIATDGSDATYGAKVVNEFYGKYRQSGLTASGLAWLLADPSDSVDAWVESTGEAI